ncbi:MAG: YheC/YheD family protein [Syntrophomonas sp.]|nr:YheC/YheD family protein [Syntrophomonas sp.]
MSKTVMKPNAELTNNPKAVVGVLTTPKNNLKYPLPTGKSAKFNKELIIAARNMGILMYCFYPEDIIWSEKRILGHTYINQGNKGKWIRDLFPLPNIVYNRLSFRKHEGQKKVQALLARLEKEPQIYLFNSRFLNKWEVHQSLSQNPLSKDLVPESCLFNLDNLNMMLSRYQSVFVKPISSSIGKGIIKVERRSNSRYLFYKSAVSNLGWNRCITANHLYLNLKKTIGSEDKYMIQKAIDLATLQSRVFDLRTEVQKNGLGQWVFIGVGVRVAARGKNVTHVPNGGSKAVYKDVIDNVFGDSNTMKQKLDSQLKYICKVAPQVLEESLDISLGILSIDIGIDKTGIMQIIEVNSKPAGFDEDDIRRQHVENLNEYFLYIVNSLNTMHRRG